MGRPPLSTSGVRGRISSVVGAFVVSAVGPVVVLSAGAALAALLESVVETGSFAAAVLTDGLVIATESPVVRALVVSSTPGAGVTVTASLTTAGAAVTFV